jgi:hypothetical protein
MVFAAPFLLLDCLRASVTGREPSALAANSTSYPELFQRIIHTSWLGPGLLLALFLMLLVLRNGPSRKPREKQGLVRKFTAPRLERYRGLLPRDHQDLEI